MNDGTADVDSESGVAAEASDAIVAGNGAHASPDLNPHDGAHRDPDRTDLSADDAVDSAPQDSQFVAPAATIAPKHPSRGEYLSRRARRKQRVSKWDRPPEPHDWRFFVGHLGRVLITTGLMMFLFVAYQLWGTGIETARAQDKLDDQFQELVQAESVPEVERPPNIVSDDGLVVDPTSSGVAFQALPFPSQILNDSGGDSGSDSEGGSEADSGTDSAVEPPAPVTPYETIVPAAEQNLPPYVRGDVLGRIEIPNIGVDFLFVPGVNHEDLKAGVGHFPDTPLPGQLGNSALAGHRTTYKAPFGNLDKVNPGEDIVITLPGEVYTYVITGTTIVNPSDYWVISNSDPNLATLTLITCTPKATSAQRLVVFAELDPSRSGPVGQATLPQLNDPQASVLPDEPPVANTVATVPSATTSNVVPTTTPVTTTAERATAPVGTVVGTMVSAATPTTAPATTAPATTVAPVVDDIDESAAPSEGGAFSGGWFDDTAAWPHIAGWGALLSIIAICAYLISRRTRHDSVGFLAGIVPFTVCLYFFFENVNRLLPPGL